MSVEAMAWVLRQRVGDQTRKLVLLGLADHAHRDGKASYPAMATLADYAECSVRQARRHLRDLQADGFIAEGDQRHTAHIRADRRPTVYDLNLARPVTDDTPSRPVTDDRPSDPRPDTGDTHDRSSSAPRPDIAMSAEPSTNRPVEPITTPPTPPRGGGKAKSESYIRAEGIVTAWWDWHKATFGTPPTAQNFVAVVKVVERVVKAGWSDSEIKYALMEVPTVSVGALEFARARRVTAAAPRARSRQEEAFDEVAASLAGADVRGNDQIIEATAREIDA